LRLHIDRQRALEENFLHARTPLPAAPDERGRRDIIRIIPREGRRSRSCLPLAPRGKAAPSCRRDVAALGDGVSSSRTVLKAHACVTASTLARPLKRRVRQGQTLLSLLDQGRTPSRQGTSLFEPYAARFNKLSHETLKPGSRSALHHFLLPKCCVDHKLSGAAVCKARRLTRCAGLRPEGGAVRRSWPVSQARLDGRARPGGKSAMKRFSECRVYCGSV